MRSGVITLLTDFGDRDPYVGIMKGVILGIHPQARPVDLTHQVRPQDVEHAAFLLGTAVEYFPPGTVHLAVVDPGVGSARRALAVQGQKHFYVGPDNGVFSLAWKKDPPMTVREIQPGSMTLPKISATFHGRDLFAPVAAHLCRGTPAEMMGPPARDPVRFDLSANRVEDGRAETAVLHVDVFGNLVTALHRRDVSGRVRAVEVQGREIPFAATYSEVDAGHPLALWGSSDFLEVSVNRGSAAEALTLGPGAAVTALLDAD